jgi:hypothetical protein
MAEEEEHPPAYDSQLFLPSTIRHYNYYQHPPISTTYLKIACLLFFFSGFIVWFSIYTTWHFILISNSLNNRAMMLRNQSCKYIANTTGVLIKRIYGSI